MAPDWRIVCVMTTAACAIGQGPFVWDNDWEDLDGNACHSPGFRIQDTYTGECWDSLIAFVASFDFELEQRAHGAIRGYNFGPIHRHVYGY